MKANGKNDSDKITPKKNNGRRTKEALVSLTNIPDNALVYLRDCRTGHINWCNEKTATFFGMTRPEVVALGNNLYKKIAHPDDFFLIPHSTNHYKVHKENFGGVLRVRPVGGKDWHWLVGISTIFTRDAEDNALETLCVFMDLTEIIRTDQHISEMISHVLSLPYQKLYEKITARERQIIQLLGQGYSNTEIARQLFVSRHTIDTHRKNIRNKLNIHNTSELISLSRKLGL